MNLYDANIKKKYIIKDIIINDEELVSFLFSLGCYIGEEIIMISSKNSGRIISIKNAKYNIDNNLAKAIIVE
jgi:ferrous iron transport protein A